MIIQLFIAAIAGTPVAWWRLRKVRNDGLIQAENAANPDAYDAVVKTHRDTMPSQVPDSDFPVRHLLVKRGSTGINVDIAGASDIPIGTVDNITTVAGGDKVAVLLFGKGQTKKATAAGVIAAGAECFTAAAGQVQARPTASGTYWYVGTALSSAGAAGDLIEILDTVPVKLTI